MSMPDKELLSAALALYEAYAEGRLERLIIERARYAGAACGGVGTPPPIEAFERLGVAIEGVEDSRANDTEIETARHILESYCGTEQDLEVDDDAEHSPGEDGMWVSSWVLVPLDDDSLGGAP